MSAQTQIDNAGVQAQKLVLERDRNPEHRRLRLPRRIAGVGLLSHDRVAFRTSSTLICGSRAHNRLGPAKMTKALRGVKYFFPMLRKTLFPTACRRRFVR
jgi:hypothetical protein